jgi:hypothetical protein
MLVTRLDFFSFRQNGKQILFVNLFWGQIFSKPF